MRKSKIKLGMGIFIVAIIVNIIVETEFYQGLIVALSSWVRYLTAIFLWWDGYYICYL